MNRLSSPAVFAWITTIIAAVIGVSMIAVGMFEELPGIIRDVWDRSFHQ